MKHFIYKSILAVSCIYLYSGYANAACTLNPNLNNKLANVPAAVYNVQYDDNTPRDLGSLSASFSSTSQWVASDSSSCATSYLTGSFINSWSPNANKVALSNISGIGISVTTAGIGAFNASWDKNNANYNILTTNWSITVKKTRFGNTRWHIKSRKCCKANRNLPCTNKCDLDSNNFKYAYQCYSYQCT